MKIFIIGFMCSGKSTIGKKLAKELGFKHIDTDNFIESKFNIAINDFFAKYGEDAFRTIERKALLEIIDMGGDYIISTGGGMPCYNDNISLIKQKGISIYLEISPKSILTRLESSKKTRPLLQNKTNEELIEYINTTLKAREVFYHQADITLKSENIHLKSKNDKQE